MGTNFYLRKIPTEEQRSKLKNLIDLDSWKEIKELTEKLYGDFSEYTLTGNVIHLGKRSGGWKFLWNPNVYVERHGHIETIPIDEHSSHSRFIPEPNTLHFLYPLTKEGIWNFINQDNTIVFDEYDKILNKKEFFEEALNWTTWQGKEAWDSDSYDKECPNKYSFYPLKSELISMLEEYGYKLSKNKSDFYSDGLRFSTSTQFS